MPETIPRASDEVEEQVRVLTSGAVDVISEDELRRRLGRGTPLRVKLGIDPTASDIHLGFAVVLRKLRQFQDLGHVAVLILGDFTAQVGDPSGRSATRPRLSPEEVEAHVTTYLGQVQRILRPDRLEVHRNSAWLAGMDMVQVLALTASVTVARMLERNDFAQRYAAGSPISLTEFLYPLLQGWDSVEVRADVELGGTDQLFNNLMGRHLQEQHGQEPQVVLTTPLLEGLDGVQKMSKSLGNYVGIAEPPAEQFGKLMAIPDALMARYFALTTGWHPDRIVEVERDLATGRLAPVEAKRLLARTVVALYHDTQSAEHAEREFDRVFKEHRAPTELVEAVVEAPVFASGPVRLARILALAGLVPSNKEGRRMIEQGAVRCDGERVRDPDLEVTAAEIAGRTLQVGRRRWARIVVPGTPR
ncbi:MAG: tyrosine--tRNA ligase [Acidimicrobiia bacterium]|nr:tyrosine--tRNA ligase [Acidimicrobiia bacterium]